MNTNTEKIQLRQPTMADLSAVVNVINADALKVVGFILESEEEYKHRWEDPGFNLDTDARVAVNAAGEVIGYVQVWGLYPYARLYMTLVVHPDHQSIAIGQQLLAWAESRGQQLVELAPPEARIALVIDFPHQDQFSHQLFREAGYPIVRHAQEMKIDFTAAPPEPVFPPNITVKTFDPATDMRPLFQALREAFRDHFGFLPTPEEEAFQRFVYRTEVEDFDPTLWFMAMDETNGEIAGMSMCRPTMPEDPNMAWVDNLAVRRPWRRQGLALALLHYTFGEFYRRGKTSVALGVDSQSLTGATRLYEKAGMHIYQQFDMVEKVLREGVELTTTMVEE